MGRDEVLGDRAEDPAAVARGGGGLLEPLPQPAQPARLLCGHAGHQAGGRHALRQAARHEDRFMELITEENGV